MSFGEEKVARVVSVHGRWYLNRARDDDYRLLVAFRYGVVLVTVRSRYHADLSPDILAHDSGLT